MATRDAVLRLNSRDDVAMRASSAAASRRTSPPVLAGTQASNSQMHALAYGQVKPSITDSSPVRITSSPVPMEAIAELACKWGVPMNDVLDLYQAEIDCLAPAARIANYLVALAVSRTNARLRARRRKHP